MRPTTFYILRVIFLFLFTLLSQSSSKLVANNSLTKSGASSGKKDDAELLKVNNSTLRANGSRRSNPNMQPKTNSTAQTTIKQKDLVDKHILHPYNQTLKKFMNTTPKEFKTVSINSKSGNKNRWQNRSTDASAPHMSQNGDNSSRTNYAELKTSRISAKSESSAIEKEVKVVSGDHFIPISLRAPGKHLDVQIVLPNFFTHVVHHRDKYRLVIPHKNFATVRIVNESLSNNSSVNETHSAVEKNESDNLGPRHVDTTVAVLQHIIEQMRTRRNPATSSAKSKSQEFVQIGHTSVSCDRVAAVGDVDQNGIVDFVVSSPGKNGKRGSARLYLMGKNNTFLYSRDLIPGQWGFDAPPLQPGDLYGSVVHALPVVSAAGMYSLIVIGAPGDLRRDRKHEGEYLNERSHVYVLKVSRKGNVLNNVQLPLQEFERLTGKYVEAIHRLGTQVRERWSEQPKKEYDEEFEEESKFLDAVEGVRTITFKTAKGEVRATIRVDDERGQKLLRKIDEYVAKVPVSRLETTYIGEPTIRVLQQQDTKNQECIYSDNECACKQMTPEQTVEKCYSLIGEVAEDGIGVCNVQYCDPRYICACDGNELCRREKRTMSIMEAIGKNAEGKDLCRTHQVQRTVMVLADPANIKSLTSSTESTPKISLLPAYNDTHCVCSLNQLSEATRKRCLQYVRTITAKAVVCKERACDVSKLYECDWSGTAYCKHYRRSMELYLNDGNKDDELGHYYCHREKTSRTVVEKVL